MTTTDISTFYEQQIKGLPRTARLALLAQIAQDLATTEPDDVATDVTLLELEGLGAEVWQGVDAQQYVNTLRNEWERPA